MCEAGAGGEAGECGKGGKCWELVGDGGNGREWAGMGGRNVLKTECVDYLWA